MYFCPLLDTKNSQGVGPNSISELAFNAVSVKWNPRDGPVRVSKLRKELHPGLAAIILCVS